MPAEYGHLSPSLSTLGVGGSDLWRRATEASVMESEPDLCLDRGTGNASALGASGGNKPNVVPFGVLYLQTT